MASRLLLPFSPDVSIMVGICSSVVFLFYRVCHTTPWSFGRIFRAPLYYWGFHFDCFLLKCFEEVLKLSLNLIALSTQYGHAVISQSFRFSHILYLGLPDPSTVLYLRQYCGILVLFFPVRRGSGFIGGLASWLQAMSWEVLWMPFISVLSWQRGSLQAFLPYLWQYFRCSRLFSYSIEEQKIK